ncbi:MAG: hypothetical protein ACRC5A_14750 [Enterobacteriaceae bacterium]
MTLAHRQRRKAKIYPVFQYWLLSLCAGGIQTSCPRVSGAAASVLFYSGEASKGNDRIPPEYQQSYGDDKIKGPNLGAVAKELGGGASGTPDGWGPEDEENARNPQQHEKYKIGLRKSMEKPVVKDPKLQRIMDKLYRPNAKIGNGSTADAVRHEIATGEKVGGRLHTQKAQDHVRELQAWLRQNQSATPGDRAAAENVIKDLQNALGGK